MWRCSSIWSQNCQIHAPATSPEGVNATGTNSSRSWMDTSNLSGIDPRLLDLQAHSLVTEIPRLIMYAYGRTNRIAVSYANHRRVAGLIYQVSHRCQLKVGWTWSRMVSIISNYATLTGGGNMATTWLISPRKQTSLPKRCHASPAHPLPSYPIWFTGSSSHSICIPVGNCRLAALWAVSRRPR
jgi:hypothetical protein